MELRTRRRVTAVVVPVVALVVATTLLLRPEWLFPIADAGRSGSTAVALPATTQPGPDPSPGLSPQQVVKIQMEAMKGNDATDAGIAVVFKFASPANQQMTGPLERFAKMVRAPAYLPMLNCKSVEYGWPEVRGGRARVLVKVVGGGGEVALYWFVLSRQDEGAYKDCWMTDGVIRVEPGQLEEAEEKGFAA